MTDRSLWPRHTPRLVLRPPNPGDIDQILTYRNLPEVGYWIPRRIVDPERFRAAWLESVDDPDDHSIVAELGGRVIGSATLTVADSLVPGQHGPAKTLGELGYIIDPAQAGHGYATELATALLDLAFGDLGLRRVVAGCYAGNLASVRVLEKLGMRREQHGRGDSWHDELGWVDGCTYAMLRDEWLSRAT